MNSIKFILSNLDKIEDIEISGIDTKDYPDFVDGCLESATLFGLNLNEDELDYIQDNCEEWMYKQKINSIT